MPACPPTSRITLLLTCTRTLIICLLLASCTSIGAPALSPAPPELTVTEESGCRIKIGIITSLSGEYQGRATELVQGYDLARDDINAAGGVLGCSLDLIYRDDASTSIAAGRAMQTLVEIDEVLLVAGSIASVITLDLVPLSANLRIPLLAHNSINSLITDLGYEWVFRTMPSAWNLFDQLVSYINQLPLTDMPTVALLYENSSFGQDAYVTLRSRLKAYGISLVAALPIPADASLMTPLLPRLQESGANVLFLVGSSVSEAVSVMAQIEAANLNFDAYLSPGGAYNSAEFLESHYADQIISPIPWVSSLNLTDELSGQTTAEFLVHFSTRYGAPPSFRTVNAYVNIYLAKAAIETALSAPPQGTAQVETARRAIRDSLHNLHLEHTLFGSIDFDASGQNATTIMITQLVAGELVVISPEALATGDLIIPAPVWAERNRP